MRPVLVHCVDINPFRLNVAYGSPAALPPEYPAPNNPHAITDTPGSGARGWWVHSSLAIPNSESER